MKLVMPASTTEVGETRPLPLSSLRISVFSCVLIYYWTYLYFRVLIPPPDESSVSYALTVLPAALFSASGVALAMARGARQLVDRTSIALVVFIAIAGLVSVARGDWATLRAGGLMALTLIWIGTLRGELSVATLNRFFVASIAAGATWYLAGFSEYGLLPGQYAEGVDRGLEWRVSLFPFVAESGFLALIIFLANQLHRRGWTRLLFCTASLYFMILSGVRSALLALVLCEVYVIVNSLRRSKTLRTTQIVLLLAAFVALVALSGLATMLPTFTEGTLANYLFRTGSFGENEAALSQSVYRSWLWLQHIALFLSAPLTGIGTFEFSAVVPETLFEDQDEKGSESFLTGWLARLGACFLPFIFYLAFLCRRAAATPDLFAGALLLVFGVAALTYGSFLVPYNFIFLVLFRLLHGGTTTVAVSTPPPVHASRPEQ